MSLFLWKTDSESKFLAIYGIRFFKNKGAILHNVELSTNLSTVGAKEVFFASAGQLSVDKMVWKENKGYFWHLADKKISYPHFLWITDSES